MTLLPDNDAAVSPGPRGDRAELDVQQFDWKDVNGTVWSGEVSAQHLRLQSDAQRLALPADTWHKDLYVVPHGRNILVRIETFDCAVRFILPPEQAAPLLRLLDAPPEKDATPDVAVDDTPSPTDLLWPKMSPLAVWALIFSALVFVPFVGLLAAAATVVLLILHRRTVRRAVAWRHSRIVCAASVVFLVGGLVVSALATWGLRQRFSDAAGLAGLAGNAAPNEPTWGVLAGGVFVVLLSLSVHEAAHAIAAWWLGDGLARSLGRVTLSPLAHIDLFGTIILPIMLVVAKMPVFGYARPVPVSVDSLPRRHRAHILISLAGPGSNLLLAAASLMLMLALGCTVRMFAPDAHVSNLAPLDLRALFIPVSATGFVLASVFGPFCTILKLSFFINTVLAVFNLIPIPPLDGSWVLENLFPGSLGRFYATIRPYAFLIFVLAIYAGLFKYLLIPVGLVIFPGLYLLSEATGM